MSQNQIKNDVFTIINNRIIAELEKGSIPWHKPWKEAGPPRNLISGRSYRGINLLLLSSLGFSSNVFLSSKQINDLGGLIIKGERSCPVVFWSKKEETGNDGERKEKRILRYYSVFNVEQCKGLPEYKLPKVELFDNNPIKACETVIENMPVKPIIQHKKQEAYYSAETDTINMPKLKTFVDSESYYGTLFHELIHWTGHESRLNRESVMKPEFGKELYAEEELVAQIGSCSLASHTGCTMKHFPNDVAYISGWLEKLKGDKRLILFASAKAQRAVDYVLNTHIGEAIVETEIAEIEH